MKYIIKGIIHLILYIIFLTTSYAEASPKSCVQDYIRGLQKSEDFSVSLSCYWSNCHGRCLYCDITPTSGYYHAVYHDTGNLLSFVQHVYLEFTFTSFSKEQETFKKEFQSKLRSCACGLYGTSKERNKGIDFQKGLCGG